MEPSPATPLRLFLGLWPPPPLAVALQGHADAWTWPAAARRTPPERLHITLHFLGDVPAARVPELRDGLAVPWSGCAMTLDQAVVWPGGIAVLEAITVPAALQQLHAELAEKLRQLALAVEQRRYRPHVTLARKATGARPPAGFTPLRWDAAPEYLLLQSLPGGRGYTPLHRFG